MSRDAAKTKAAAGRMSAAAKKDKRTFSLGTRVTMLGVVVLAFGLSLLFSNRSSAAYSLTWPPPSCGGGGYTCVDLKLSNTGSHQTPSLHADDDYRIHLPSTPLVGGLTINGGHNVIIIGGEIDLSVPCSDASSACPGIYITKPTAGQVFLEGVWIHDPHTIPSTCPAAGMPCSTGDGIDVNDSSSTPSTITLENLRIDGISGCSGGSDHADVFQPYAAGNAEIHIDHLTGVSNCQGMTIDPDLAYSQDGTYAAGYVIENTNLDISSNPYSGDGNRYAWWLTYNLDCNSGPITLSNAYTQEPSGALSINSVWPDTDQPASCESVWNSSTKRLTFPSSPQISGYITEGLPPGGDYVPVGVAGIGYVSPGYGSGSSGSSGSTNDGQNNTETSGGSGSSLHSNSGGAVAGVGSSAKTPPAAASGRNPSAAPENNGSSSLTVTIVDAHGHHVAAVTVAVGGRQAKTDSNGVATFAGLSSGRYTITVTASGQKAFTKSVTLGSGENESVSYELPGARGLSRPRLLVGAAALVIVVGAVVWVFVLRKRNFGKPAAN